MELSTECIAMLELLNRPAFFTDGDLIIRTNNMAKKLGVTENMPLSDFIGELGNSEGAVLTKRFNDIYYTVTPSSVGNFTLYIFEETVEQNAVSSIASAAQHLRRPITSIGSSLLNMKALLDNEQLSSHMQHATKELFSLHRTVRNMSDISMLLDHNPSKKTAVSISTFFKDLVEKIAAYLTHSGVNITYSDPDVRIYCLIDEAIMERAVYNMISNSLNAGSRNIHVSLCTCDNSLQLTITDDGRGISDEKKTALVNRFQKAPSLSNTEDGLGLGMHIVHAAAIRHNGTVMITDVKPNGCKVALTFSIVKGPLTVKQKPVTPIIELTGGFDPILIEFSDYLKPEDFI